MTYRMVDARVLKALPLAEECRGGGKLTVAGMLVERLRNKGSYWSTKERKSSYKRFTARQAEP